MDLMLMHNAILNSFSILILIVICIHFVRSEEFNNLQNILFFLSILLTIILLFIDIMAWFEGNADTYYSVLNHLGNFLLYAMGPALPSLWFMYCFHQIFRDEKRTKRLMIPLGILMLMNLIMVIFSQFKGYYYYIDSENIFHRGALFYVPAIIILAMLIFTMILVLIHRFLLTRKQFISLMLLPVLPILMNILQIRLFGTSLVLNSPIIAILIIFLNIQNEQINTDYLTGLNNKKRFDEYLRKKISSYVKDKPFAAIMIDMNNFKDINDRFGHSAGDAALQRFSNILKESVGRKSFIARVGGDEFCIIIDSCDRNKLEEVIRQINDSIEEYNQSSIQSCKLSFSMGYAVYEDANVNMDEFFHTIDQLMYDNKKMDVNRNHAI